MITLLTSLKPFRGAAIQLQKNALSNWKSLDPDIEIIVYGDGEGVAEHAQRFGAKHVADIRGNEKGVPDFGAIVDHATAHAQHEIHVYLNGDILLPPDFIQQANMVSFGQYLMIGQRIDLHQEADFALFSNSWKGEILRCHRRGHAKMHGPTGQDYFVFRRGTWQGLPPLIVGRGNYDNALIAHCLRRGIPIVDATWSIHVVHQWHDYSHVAGAKETFGGQDAIANARLHDIEHSKPDNEDANWRLIDGKVVKSAGSRHGLRRLEILLRYKWGLKRLSYVCRGISRLAWLFGFLKPRTLLLDAVICSERSDS